MWLKAWFLANPVGYCTGIDVDPKMETNAYFEALYQKGRLRSMAMTKWNRQKAGTVYKTNFQEVGQENFGLLSSASIPCGE